MTPSECAARLAAGTADIGLIPIAALATNPGLRILPGCTIASKDRVRSLLLVRRADQPLTAIRSVAADTASRTTVAYARILFHKWGNPTVPFMPMAADLDSMLDRADAAIIIGDPALLALEERSNRSERTSEELVYHDLAQEWRTLTGLPFRLRRLGCGTRAAFWTIMLPRISFDPAFTASKTSTHWSPNGQETFRSLKAPSAGISPPTSTTSSTTNALKA